MGEYWLKITYKESPHTNHSSSQKTRLNDLSYDIKIWTDLSTILSQSMRLTDRQTDRQTVFSSLDHICIPCSAVKILRRPFVLVHVYCEQVHCGRFVV